MKLAVIGGGAWGTALAISANARHSVTLLARDAAHVRAMQAQSENTRYLPGVALPPALRLLCTDALGGQDLQWAGTQDLVVLATPIAGLREWLARLCGSPVPVVWLCKGFETPNSKPFGLLAHEIQSLIAPDIIAGVLSGPSFASEVARGQPTALVVASAHALVRQRVVEAFHGGPMRIYANDDVVGVEVGGAVKNVLAIATGLCDGLGLGLNARAALITRGLAEMARLGVALGARAETFMGLTGMGDLTLTATGDLSRNRTVGMCLAGGRDLAQILAELGHVAEGVHTARETLALARRHGVEMPITEAVCAVLFEGVEARSAVSALLSRDARPE